MQSLLLVIGSVIEINSLSTQIPGELHVSARESANKLKLKITKNSMIDVEYLFFCFYFDNILSVNKHVISFVAKIGRHHSNLFQIIILK